MSFDLSGVSQSSSIIFSTIIFLNYSYRSHLYFSLSNILLLSKYEFAICSKAALNIYSDGIFSFMKSSFFIYELHDVLSNIFAGIALNDISKSSISFKQIEFKSSDYFLIYNLILFSYSCFSFCILWFSLWSMIKFRSFNSSVFTC